MNIFETMSKTKKRTLQERLVVALLEKGYTRDPHAKTRKYIVFVSATAGGYIYVGKAGALRVGPTIGASVPADRFRAQLLLEVPS